MIIPGHGTHPSFSGRPTSNYTIGTTANFAGVGSNRANNHQHSPSAGTGGKNGRPASSFYDIDGHSAMEYSPPIDGSAPMPSPPSQVAQMRQIGHGGNNPSNRISRVSFAESSFTNKDPNRRTSYFGSANSIYGGVSSGTGNNRNSNGHKYRNSLAASLHSNNVPMPPLPIASQYSPPLGDASRSGSDQDLAGILTPSKHGASLSNGSSVKTGYRPSSLAYSNTAFAENDTIADNSALLHPPAPEKQQIKPKKHNITISTSMPFISPPKGRESILSPDDLLKAYASSKSSSSNMSSPALTHQNSQQSSFFDLTAAGNANAEEELADDRGKKSKFSAKKFGFGFAK